MLGRKILQQAVLLLILLVLQRKRKSYVIGLIQLKEAVYENFSKKI